MSIKTNMKQKLLKRKIVKSGLFDEKYYGSQFKDSPADLLEYYIAHGAEENKNPSSIFNQESYYRNNPDVKEAKVNPLIHYLEYGKNEGRKIIENESVYDKWRLKRKTSDNCFKYLRDLGDIVFILKETLKNRAFDGAWYLNEYPDVADIITSKRAWQWRFSSSPVKRTLGRMLTTPVIHYVRYGMYEYRNPSKYFSTAYYMNSNEELINAKRITPFVHYLKYGKNEGRTAYESYDNVVTFNEIFNENAKKECITDSIVVSIITDKENYQNACDISYANKEVILYEDSLAKSIEKATGQLLCFFSGADSERADFINSAARFMTDESIFAVILDNSYQNESTIISYNDFIRFDDLQKIRFFSKENVMIRNPHDALHYYTGRYDLDNDSDFNLFLLEYIAGSKVVILNDEKCSSECCEYSRSDCMRYFDIVADKYCLSSDRKLDFIHKFRDFFGNRFDDGFSVFTEKVDIRKSVSRKHYNILIGIYGFTFGGGEIMPIRLANKLKEMGHNVLVCSYLNKNQAEKKVRRMLRCDIPVIYTKNINELHFYVKNMKIQVINTHHQAVNSLISELIAEYPELKADILNVSTSHGMFESLEEQSMAYLFKETKLIENTDYWTYVADKNIKPFEKYNVYDKDKFIKIPNGMEMPETNPVDLTPYVISKDSFTVAVVSRALPQKGWLNAINAVTKAREITKRDIHLLLIGEGEVYDKYADKLGSSFIHFLGFKDNPCDYFKAVDLCMLPSYYLSESAPLCLIEAMMCGKASIASDIGDVKYILEYGNELAGDIFPLENGAVNDGILTEKLVKMVTDADFYNHAREIAVKKSKTFEISNICERYVDVFSKYEEKCLKSSDEALTEKIEALSASSKFLADAEEGTSVPLVSVIVPNYNHSRYLPKRLDCIFNQTYKNIEVLLLDDCSSDNSREILEGYAAKYPNKSRVLFNEHNSGGVFFQWAKGIKNSAGSICWIAESDDYCDTDFLEKVIPAFGDKDVKLSYCRYCFVDENDNRNENGFFNYVKSIDNEKWHHNYINTAENEVETALAIKNTIPNASGAVFRKPENNPVFDNEEWYRMKICGDWIFYLNIIKDGKVAYNAETTSYFRFHSNNSSAKTYTNDTYYIEHEMVAIALRKLYSTERSVIEKNHEIIRKFYHEHVKDGTDKKFNELYNVDKVMRFYVNTAECEKAIKAQSEKFNKDSYETVVVNPIISIEKLKGDETTSQKMEYAGMNTGNMIFVDAVKEQTNYIDEIWFNGPNLKKLEAKSNISAVIPSSNFIIAGSDRMVDSIRKLYESTDSPITMVGLGAQAYPPNDTPKKLVAALSQNKIDFFKMAAERAVSLGVRGEFTAECLEIMGIKNYRIIGCPTCYKYLDGIYKELKTPTADKVIFNVTGKNAMESRILEMGIKNNYTWLLQMMTELPQLLDGDTLVDDAAFKRSFPKLSISQTELKEFMKKNAKIFFNVKEWNEYMQNENFTFSFGSRFHGNMSALRNGIPSLWITHDSRTTELIDVLKLPHISISEFVNAKDINELIEHCDYSEFYKAYPKLTAEYVKFLDENHINHKFTLNETLN